MIKKKAKVQKAADLLNEFVDQELALATHYSADEVLAKIDNVIAKAKKFYSKFQKPSETGRETTDNDLAVDVEAASLAWPFRTFFDVFKTHPTLGPGMADDSNETPENQGLEAEEQSLPQVPPQDSQGLSRLQLLQQLYLHVPKNLVTKIHPPAKRRKETEKEKQKKLPELLLLAAFLEAIAAQQEESQRKQFEYEVRLQQMMM